MSGPRMGGQQQQQSQWCRSKQWLRTWVCNYDTKCVSIGSAALVTGSQAWLEPQRLLQRSSSSGPQRTRRRHIGMGSGQLYQLVETMGSSGSKCCWCSWYPFPCGVKSLSGSLLVPSCFGFGKVVMQVRCFLHFSVAAILGFWTL